MNEWSIETAKQLYNIEHWSDGFFDIDEQGRVVAYPNGDRTRNPIVLKELVDAIQQKNLSLPILIRFNEILHTRVKKMRDAFQNAINTYQYQNHYTPVYPIKSNQQQRVIRELLHVDMSLEAGSKPELLAVIGLSQKQSSLILCNGYKDREYIRLALIAKKMGHRVYIIIEKFSELVLTLEEAKAMNIEPLFGIRIRPASISAGKWQNTGGERGKFGLSAAQVLNAVELLKKNQQLHTLQLLHFHMGSQVANIRDIQNVMKECARFYAELHQLGAMIKVVDVGGGLGVDYEGTRSRNFCSINYSLQEYANNVVHALADICKEKNLAHPEIMTESGRALVAHHAVLITDVIDKENIADVIELPDIAERSVLETYHDAIQNMNEAHSMFTHGLLSLQQRAEAEKKYIATCVKVRDILQKNFHRSQWEILNDLNEKLADKYFCNFSLFQSIPDVWGIDQIFPILPLSGLNHEPTRRVILHDLTCDSDGQVKQYVDGQGIETTLPLPAMHEQTPYLIGFFLVGAYQEILGDMHNLFGDTDSVHVSLTVNGYQLEQPFRGDNVKDVLRYVHIDAEALMHSYQQQLNAAELTEEQKSAYFKVLSEGLTGYTYFEEE